MGNRTAALGWISALVLISISACQHSVPLCESVYVSTLAGNGSTGDVDGTGTATGTAEFIAPFGIALDSQANAYVADLEDNHIRVIDPSGDVTSLTVQGPSCPVSQPSGDPQLCAPWSIALDQSGLVVVGKFLQEISPSGDVTTMGLTSGAQDADWGAGLLSSAGFGGPNEAIAADGQGNLYVSDLTEVRRIDPQGNVTIVAGGAGAASVASGANPPAELLAVAAIALDAQGNIYVADGNVIKKISPSRSVSILAGSGASGWADGAATRARFNSPEGLAADSQGNVFVSDTGNNRIRRIDASGTVTTIAGSGQTDGNPNRGGFLDGSAGPAGTAQFNEPAGIAVDSQDNLYVADFANDRIRFIPQCQ